MKYVVAAFYKFAPNPDYKAIQPKLLAACRAQNIKGTILLAEEGINSTIAGTRQAMDHILAYIRSFPQFADLEHKESYTDEMPFYRTKVKLKKEIVTLGVGGIDPNREVGEYVTPQAWNDLISDPDVIVVDTRNQYEVDIGTFKGAKSPETDTFREFPDYVAQHLADKKDKKIAMFCTGGIRCEKSTAFLLKEGFKHVYHLQGGILKYLEEMPAKDSLWEGECFVFDNRVAVDHALAVGHYDQCHGCRHPITEEDKSSPLYEAGVSCPACHNARSTNQQARARERQKQIQLAKSRNHPHIGQSVDGAAAAEITH